MKVKRKVVVLIPAYQPSTPLIESTNRLLKAGLDIDIVIVNDGSGDKYNEIFGSLDKKVRLIEHDINKGKGRALKTGFEFIKNNYQNYIVVTADADGQHQIKDILKLAKEYTKNEGSLLLGSRAFDSGNVPFRSRFGNTLTRKIFSLVTKRKIGDTQTGLRAFDDSLIDFMEGVPGERFEYEMNVLLECSGAGVSIKEMPIKTVYENNNASSHFDPIKDSIKIYGQIIKFASSSLLSFGLDYVMFLLLIQLTGSWKMSSSIVFSNVLARFVSASFNFTINKRLVFKKKGNVVRSLSMYVALAGFILVINTVILSMLISGLGMKPFIAKVITELTCFVISYLIQKKFVFAQKVNPQA